MAVARTLDETKGDSILAVKALELSAFLLFCFAPLCVFDFLASLCKITLVCALKSYKV